MNRLRTLLLAALTIISATMALAQPPAPPSAPSGQMLDVWTFAGTNFLSFRRITPIVQTNVTLVSTWDGNGLQMDASDPASLVYPIVTPNGHVELSCSNGSVEMWFSPDWNSTDGLGDWGTVLEVGTWNTNLASATGAWGLYISPNGSNLCFSAQASGMSTNYLNSPIAWNAGDWHQIVLTYSATNTALYLDGELATNGPGISIIPGAGALTNGFSIGSDGLGTGMLQARAVYNQLITYNYELDAETISNNYVFDSELVGSVSSGGFHMNILSPPDPPGDPGTNVGVFDFNSPSYTNSDFWVEAAGIDTNGVLTLLVHATTNNSTYAPVYELLWTDNLAPPVVWNVMQTFLGTTNTNFTALTVPVYSNATMFFEAVNLGTNSDSTGNGLPDGWQRQYFGYVGVDPFGNPMGDGYNNLYKYQHGMNPNTFYTPAAPTQVTTIFNTNGNIVISWPGAANLPSSGGGAVTGYTLQINDGFGGTTNISLGTNQLSYTNSLANDFALQTLVQFPYDSSTQLPTYSLRVNYANTNSQWSPLQVSFDPTCTVDAAVVRGPQGALYLAASSVPTNVVAIRVMSGASGIFYALNPYNLGLSYGPASYNFADVEWFDQNIVSNSATWPWPSFDVPISEFTNGLYKIPTSLAPLFGAYSLNVMGIGANGNIGRVFIGSPTNDWDFYFTTEWMGPHNDNIPFFDGRTNIAQNINLFLRGASPRGAFTLALGAFASGGRYMSADVYIQQPTNYVWDGFSFQSLGYFFNYTTTNWDTKVSEQRNEFAPFEETSIFTNVVFNLNLFDASGFLNGALAVGADTSGDEELDVGDPSKLFSAYNYVTNNPSLPVASMPVPTLTQSAEDWICSFGDMYTIDGGIYNITNNNYTIPSGLHNVYGLSYETIRYLDSDTNWTDVGPGSTFSTWSVFFQKVTPPVLSTSGYYFGRPRIESLPGESGFSVTNTSPLFITTVGKPFFITAWAKQSVLNGYSGVYAYPQQYFDKAFLADTNGNISTNQTGILSEYGDFFPTTPGKVFLTTKPDAATGSVGTNVVNVIKLQVDANHDGEMDLSFAGPDNTSADRPFLFWVNNDTDVPTKTFPSGEDLDDPKKPDYLKQNIPSQRDLEDWARLWICGLPTLSSNYQVTLSWNVTGTNENPAINLVKAVETNGGSLYLTDTNIAAEQAGGSGAFMPSYKFQTNISPGNPFTFRNSDLTNSNNFFLFEGANPGKGELVLTVSQGTNVLAQTSTWIELHDIEDFLERGGATNVTSGHPPSSLVSNFRVIQTAKCQPPDETKQVIIFIHGINNTVPDYESSTRTIFKRLYWSGYHGRVASFRWPCAYLPWTTLNPFQYNLGEYYAFKSATALKNYLGYMRTNRSDLAGYEINLYAHSQGNVVTSEAVLQGAPFDNYILTQGAIPAHCYDTNAPFLQKLLNAETNSPNAVQTPFYPTNGGYHGYCSAIHGNLIDFFNTNDFALATGVTYLDFFNLIGLQTNWEEDQRAQKPEAFVGGPSYIYDTNTLLTTGYYTFGSSYTVTDLQEIKALVARSRSKAVGAQGGLHGAITGQTDLSVNFGFGNTRPEHSAQFVRPIQMAKPYWDEVVRTISPATP